MAKLYLGNNEISNCVKAPVSGESLSVTPSTSAQTLTPTTGKDGFTNVSVSAVTASIDSNIKSSNIKKNIVILGVTGSLKTEEKIGIFREVSPQGVYRMPTTSFTFSLPSGATDVSKNALCRAFELCTGLTSVDLSSLTTISGNSALYLAFFYCRSLTGALDLSSLTTISGNRALYQAFQGCTSLTSVDLSSLTTVSGANSMYSAFQGCTGLTSVDLSSLTTISGGMYQAFRNCTGLTSVYLPSLTAIRSSYAMEQAFADCTSLQTLSFPALTSTSFGSYKNQFNGMLQRVTGCTVHFPSNLQSVIGSWSSVTGGFGGTNTTVLFDLPATT